MARKLRQFVGVQLDNASALEKKNTISSQPRNVLLPKVISSLC